MSQAAQPTGTPDTKFAPPYLNAVNPEFGKVGAMVSLNGENLAAVDTCHVQVGSQPAQGSILDHQGGDAVKARVPHGATTGNGKIWVSGPGGESNKLDFTVQAT